MKIITFIMLLMIGSIGFAQNNPINFETGGFGADWMWTVFENDTNPPLEIIANPDASGANTSVTVAKFTALQAGQPFAGVETMHGADIGTFTLDETNATVKILVWKSVISDVGIKFATADGASTGEFKVANTLVNQWEELTFDFTPKIGEPSSTDIDQIVVFPDFNPRTADNIIYFDLISFDAGVVGDPVELPVDFEDTSLNYNIEGFEGADSAVEANPDQSGINTSATVVRTIKTVGAQFYAGTILPLSTPIDFSASEMIAIKTWSPKMNIPVRLKLENFDGSQFVELDVNTTVENQWEELVWDFTGMTAGIDFTKVVVFFEFIVDLPGDGSTYYYDDVKVFSILGTYDNSSLSLISYPNPVINNWNITSVDEISEITIFNILGERILNVSPKNTNYSIDMGQFDSGIYLINIRSLSGIQTLKILKD